MLAMDPCNRLSGERGFLVLVFLFYFLHLPADGTPSYFKPKNCPFLISGISKHLAYGGCCPPPGTCLESPTLAQRACVGNTHRREELKVVCG